MQENFDTESVALSHIENGYFDEAIVGFKGLRFLVRLLND